jgi:hypothetical protein
LAESICAGAALRLLSGDGGVEEGWLMWSAVTAMEHKRVARETRVAIVGESAWLMGGAFSELACLMGGVL